MKYGNKLKIKQKRELSEIFIGIQTKNKYAITNEADEEILFAYEESSLMNRQFMGNNRKTTFQIADKENNIKYTLNKKLRFFYDEGELFNDQKELIAKIKLTGLIKRKFKIINAQDEEIYELKGNIFRPWTFRIKKDKQTIGSIKKRWSGARELYSKADNFLLELENIPEQEIFIALTIMLDLKYFEKRR